MRANIKSYFSILFLFFSIYLHAENKPGIEHISSNNGLSHNTIRCMIQDKTGFMWFGSLNGLNRFDGIKMKSFIPESKNPNSLTSGKIKRLYLDSKGHIWVRTYSDIVHCYDPMTENFIQLYDKKADLLIKHNFYYEDKQANVWLGSVTNGCVKISFDGKKVISKTFSTTDETNKIPSNTITDIFQDSQLNTWILTSKGITCVNNDKIIPILKNRLKTIRYLKAYEINNKVYFVGENGTITVYNLKEKNFTSDFYLNVHSNFSQIALLGAKIVISSESKNDVLIFDTSNNTFLSGESFYGERITGGINFITNEFGDVLANNFSGNVWIWIKKLDKTIKLNLIPPTVLHLIDDERFQFLGDKHGNLWISTYGNGLFSYNIASGLLSHFRFENNKDGLATNYLLSLALDKNENIWVGTENMGLNKLSFANRNVQMLYPDPQNEFHNGNVIRSFLEDSKGNIWVSTKAGNLYIYDATLQTKKPVFENKYNVYSMIEDRQGSIWLTTKKDGLIELKDGKLSKAVQYSNTGKPGCLNNNMVFSVIKDRKDRIWAATFGGGLCVKTTPEGTEGFRTFFDEDEWVKFNRYVFMDNKGEIWVASTYGIYRFKPDELLKNKKAYRYYYFTPESENCLSNPEVRYIFQDSKGGIWFATSGGGINKFIGETPQGNGIFKVYNNKQGMANDNTMAIQEDRNGFLWISTENGLHKLNPETNLFQYYRFSDDFTSNLFSETACLTCKDGKMLWGSLNGFYAFYPNKLQETKRTQNRVILTGFSIFDQPAVINEKNAPLKKSVTFSDKITLKYSDKVFHIEFANLNFTNAMANQYMYMLENYEKRWNVSGTVNTATYRNVPYGKYTFLVKSINNKGVWDNNVTKLEIDIQPPFWLSKIAILLYFILLVTAIYFAVKLIKKFNDLNNAVVVERQLTNYKLRFFTNISHEFRTPLTLIKGSVDTLFELKSKMTDSLQHLVVDLDKNTSHLMRLIDQLLEFRKLQNNKQKLNLQKTDIVVFLNDIFSSFINVAAKMNIEYKFNHTQAELSIFIDQNKVDKIVFNLLSNAFKFTPRGGKITLSTEIDYSSQMVSISVSDNGIGIPKDKQNMLFSRFMQVNFSARGTGIGLSLVNEFTALHKGTVHFNENIGGGSVFTVDLPLNDNVYAADDFLNEDIVVTSENKEQVLHISEFFNQNEDENMLNLLPISPMGDKHYKILVIDDNDDIRSFLVEKLSPYFEVLTAEDGDIGLKMSMEQDPNLIICDVMMPGMNGFDLTKKLKDDFATCHIPVILLTAYIADDHEIEGIEAGAEAYISKPFSMKHLLLQINKLLEKNEKLHQHYAGNAPVIDIIDENKLEIPQRDSQFLKMVEDLLDKHLTEPEFSVDEFAAMAKTGRTLFFKKVKFLTGYSPNELIRVRRMTKAAELLKTYKYNVSEVSYMVGINDPFYFSKCFKAQFGCSPSHYLNS